MDPIFLAVGTVIVVWVVAVVTRYGCDADMVVLSMIGSVVVWVLALLVWGTVGMDREGEIEILEEGSVVPAAVAEGYVAVAPFDKEVIKLFDNHLDVENIKNGATVHYTKRHYHQVGQDLVTLDWEIRKPVEQP